MVQVEEKKLAELIKRGYNLNILRKEASISFKKYCNNALYKKVYIRAFIRGANWAKTNKY